MNQPVLTELQEDALSELLNIGMGYAAASLSTMVNEEVQLSVPSLEFLSRQELVDRITEEEGGTASCVQQSFTGAFWGNALLMFPGDKSMSLVRALTGDTIPHEDLSDMEQDVLAEVGNIVLNSCLGSLANVLGDEINSDIPTCITGSGEEIMSNIDKDDTYNHVMLIRLDFSMPQLDLGGYVVFLLDIESIQCLKDEVDRYLSPTIMQHNG